MKQYIVHFAACVSGLYKWHYFAGEANFSTFPDVDAYGKTNNIAVFKVGVCAIGTERDDRVNDAYIAS